MTGFTRGRDSTRVAITGALAIVAFIALFFYVTDRGFSLRRSDLYVRVPSAAGLLVGDPVIYRGVAVGMVKKLIFANAGDVVIRTRLMQRLPLTTEAYAELVAVDLFGRQSLVLKDGGRMAPALVSGDTIVGSQAPQMTAKIADLGTKAERIIGDTTAVLLHEMLAGAAAATKQVAGLSRAMERMVSTQERSVTSLTAHSATVAQNLAILTNPADFNAVRTNLQHATAQLDSTTATMAGLMAGLANGEGSAGKLMRDDKLYVRTESLMASLEELVVDLKTNPKRYINLKVF